jgi:ankyrin repeat protein
VLQAVRIGYVDGLGVLLEAGADAGKPDNDGNPPLWWAKQEGRDECMQLLLEAGVAVSQATVGDLSRCGFKLSFLEQFVEQCGGREALKGKTTMDVVHGYVKPLTASTKARRLSLCQQLQEAGSSTVGTATCFGTCFLFDDNLACVGCTGLSLDELPHS